MSVSGSLHSLLDYECLLFWVTNLVLIYEPVISSASAVHWLTIHSRTLNSYESLNRWIQEWTLYYNSGRIEERAPPRTVNVLLCYSVATKRA
jgi:hypothetical protein